MKITFLLTAIHKLIVYINTSIIPKLDLMLIQKAITKFYDGIISTHYLYHELSTLLRNTQWDNVSQDKSWTTAVCSIL